MPSPAESLQLAERHLERVQTAGYEPVDWDDLALYGFYCLENAVMAAAEHLRVTVARSHPSKAAAARELRDRHDLPDIAPLLERLNQARKAVAYGDVELPDLDPEDVASEIEEYVIAVRKTLGPS